MRTKGDLGPKVGVQPEPIRKRGYHRALKRGDPWAVNRQHKIALLKAHWRRNLELFLTPVALAQFLDE